MKILFYIGAIGSGGAERVATTLANFFVLDGHEITISCDANIEMAFNLDDRIKIFNHRDRCFSTGVRRKFAVFRFLHMLSNMRKIQKEFNPDVVLSFLTTFNVYTIFALLDRKVPVIVCEHTTVSFTPPLREKIARDVLYRFADAITVLTSKDFEIWKNRYKELVVMPNPCDLRSGGKNSTCREKNVVAAGRVIDWHLKGFDNLIRCWGKLCHSFPDWKLNIAGLIDEKSRKEMDELINQYACTNVEFLGFRRDVYEIMTHSEIFALTSRREGLPMALIEAMDAGCCCVAFDVITGPSDIINDNETGLLVKNQDNDAMVNALKKVMSDNILRHKLSVNASESVQRYSVDKIAQQWYSLFNKIIK